MLNNTIVKFKTFILQIKFAFGILPWNNSNTLPGLDCIKFKNWISTLPAAFK